ncbi:hypothetical protein N836_05410 [Leptolyngbya sp. Heron Island J]|uniref:hypothetical protein n=1 Tax=Leptolyngbya sp. Heron Island J TaxID=1385935 RepID=UPI0003B9B3E0|nr:hypothetical protein [Leptolyngbya sp. Heron Island J]ESA37000.1 hypothetical protein N836_05410 [Leptolyngbya sp. Heron Island J]
MKFQRRLSEPHIVRLERQLSESRWLFSKAWWQHLSSPVFREKFWAYLLKLATGSSEPIIEKRCDRQGQTYYTIYDPVTEQQSARLSEAEVRTWLEQRYYQ